MPDCFRLIVSKKHLIQATVSRCSSKQLILKIRQYSEENICVNTVIHETICIIRFVWLWFNFEISSYKSEEIELILSFKNRIIQMLKRKVVYNSAIYTFRLVESYWNRIRRNRIMQIIPCNTVFRVSFKKVVLKFFVKKRIQHSYFPVNIAKFLKTAFVIEHGWLLSTWP